MTALVQWTGGGVLALAGWLATRWSAKAWLTGPGALAFDIGVPASMFAVVALATARPIFAGVVVCALFGGLAFADYAKRQILREPVLFVDMSELIEIVRHPHLYLPYAGPKRVIAGAVLAAALVVGLAALEPPVFALGLIQAIATLAGAIVAVLILAHPLVKPLAALLSRLKPGGEPALDSQRLGLITALFTYGVIARSERPGRRARLAPPPAVADDRPRPPVVLVQSESFFDVGRLSPDLFPNLLPQFAALSREGLSGNLNTPAWGANTVRTEFEAITGLAGAEIGFDRFNPYHALIKSPVRSLAWSLKARGYRTICLHPYDRSFYARDRVMKYLGFDEFLAAESFPQPPKGRYVSDALLTDAIVERLGEGVFIFAITMENHGPWHGPPVGEDPAPRLPVFTESADLKRYASFLRSADAMAGRLKAALGTGGVLGFYGDHLPSLPQAFAALNFTEESTDFAVWRAGMAPQRRDIAAFDIPEAMLCALDEPSKRLA